MDTTVQGSTLQPNQSNLQQPRSDLQQQPASASQGALSQEQLTGSTLRVGESVIVPRASTTSAPKAAPSAAPHYSYTLLLLIIPVILAAIMFWPQRAHPAKDTSVADDVATDESSNKSTP